MTESLRQLLADLHAERVATWDPKVLQVNIDQRQTLIDTADPGAWVKVGDQVPALRLPEVDGGEVTLESLTETGPAVLIFFRFATCPACNIALPYYARNLWPQLEALGATLTAISPQVPERLVEIKRKHELPFNVAADLDNALGRHFGVLYEFDEASKASARAKGSFIGDTTGTGTWELPQPTVVVIDRQGRVTFADVSPDWLVRTEAEPIVEAVRALTLVPAE
ncbi:MAG TPA: peroxiredoxin-like family protein [Caulobacteraceae bacterium]